LTSGVAFMASDVAVVHVQTALVTAV